MVPMFALMKHNTSTQNFVHAFVFQRSAHQILFGTKQFVPVFAAQQSALIISTGTTWLANANVLQLIVRLTSIGMKTHANASAPLHYVKTTFSAISSLTKKSVSVNATGRF